MCVGEAERGTASVPKFGDFVEIGKASMLTWSPVVAVDQPGASQLVGKRVC